MKKVTIAVLLCLMILPLAFAGGSKEKADSPLEYKIPEGTVAAGTVTFWHAMSGSRAKVVDALVEGFNKANPGITVEALYTGSYGETVTKGLAAVKAGNPPVLLQSYEVGTQSMKDSGAIIPVKNLNNGEVDFNDVVGPIKDYYSYDGEMFSMPFNSSTAMLYYNKDIFKKAGLDPDNPPKTFAEIYEYGKKIVDMGLAKGGISFGWPSWIFEQMFAYHNQYYSSNKNGRDGRADELYINNKFGVRVLSEWQKWAKDGVLVYGGRTYKANDPFLAGEFAMLVQSTSSLAGIINKADFNVGTAYLPRISDIKDKGNSVVGGASIWLMAGHSDEVNAAAWKFMQYLFEVDNAVMWHKKTGYFPVNNKAYSKLKNEGWFDQEPRFATAFDQILSGNKGHAATGVLLGNFVQIRDIVGVAIEEAVVNMKDPKEALDKAKKDCDQVLDDYLMTVE